MAPPTVYVVPFVGAVKVPVVLRSISTPVNGDAGFVQPSCIPPVVEYFDVAVRVTFTAVRITPVVLVKVVTV